MSLSLSGGQLIGSRYRLSATTPEQFPCDDVQTWTATDVTLKQQVRIIILNPHAPFFQNTLDAARRAALFDDTHVVKILSVGSNKQHGWIVTEVPLGESLTSYLASHTLSAAQAKTIIGETATVLIAASARGLRHLTLRTDNIRLDKSGNVFVDGLAIQAALEDIHTDDILPNKLNRQEALSLNNLYSILLTGNTDSDTSQRFKQLANDTGVEKKVRDMFAAELREAGPLSLSETVRILAPWDTPQKTVEGSGTETSTDDDTPHFPPVKKNTKPARSPFTKPTSSADTSTDEMTPSPSDATTTDKSTSDTAAKITQATSTFAQEKYVAAKKAWKKTQSKVASSASNATQRTFQAVVDKTPQSTKDNLVKQLDKISYIPDDGGERRFNVTKTLILLAGAFLVFGALLSLIVLLTPPNVHVPYQGPTGEPSIFSTNNSKHDVDLSSSLIDSVSVLNPEAVNIPVSDGVEQDDPDNITLAYDGKTSTVWSSWWYPTASFTSGKTGIGVAVKLKQAVPVSSIRMQVNGTGGHVAWRNTDASQANTGDIIAESSLSTTTQLVPAEPVTTDTIVLWFDTLPRDNAGRYRLVIAEIDVDSSTPVQEPPNS